MYDNLFNLNSDFFSLLSTTEKIELRKRYFTLHKEANKLAKPSKCFLCGKTCTSFCNSHTIPQFILKNISDDGLYININSFLKIPITKELVGINEVDTFYLICNDCDRKYFETYENPRNYNGKEIPQTMLAEIALKNNLRMQWKRRIETEMYSLSMELLQGTTKSSYNDIFKAAIGNNLDSNEFKNCSEYAIKAIQKQSKGYYLIDYLILGYTTKLAFQGVVALTTGFENELINNIYYMSSKYRLQYLHICIFPIGEKTHVFLFIQDGDTRYSKFYKKYRRLSLAEKLCVLNYILILYNEEWVLTSSINKELFNNETLKEILETIQRPSPGSKEDFETEQQYNDFVLNTAIKTFSLKNIPNIPNFLTPIEQ